MSYIVQISDTHLFGDKNGKLKGSNSYQNLKLVLNHINFLKEKPELMILTGDLSQDCTHESYKFLADLLDEASIEYYLIPGNHDNVDVINEVFGFQWIKNEADYNFEYKNHIFYMIDTSCYPNDYGELLENQLLRFEKDIDKNKQGIVFMHHHPSLIGSPWMDTMILRQADAFNSIIKQNPQIKAVLFGHIHQVFEQKINDTLYASAPSTCFQVFPQTETLAIEKTIPGYRVLNFEKENLETKIIWIE